ncbi:hypothetical protein BC827DRAFT_200801 [Russula dissimulans]|nr:hypothetical protein BC827DRAFT_200801 [Russula dissimulans]
MCRFPTERWLPHPSDVCQRRRCHLNTPGSTSVLKTILYPIILKNDGNGIFREIEVPDSAAKVMIELTRTQDGECRNRATSMVILATCVLSPTDDVVQVMWKE